MQVHTGKDSQCSDCLPSHFLRNVAGAFFITDKIGGVPFLCLYDGLRFAQVQFWLKKLHVPLVGYKASTKHTSLVQIVKTVAESSFYVHFHLDGSWHVHLTEKQ